MILPPRLSTSAIQLLRALPLRWRATARRRRFLFLGACAPGYAALALLPIHKSLPVLIVGLLLMGAAWSVRSLSEPFFVEDRAQ